MTLQQMYEHLEMLRDELDELEGYETPLNPIALESTRELAMIIEHRLANLLAQHTTTEER